MAIQNEKFGFEVKDSTTGQPLSGAFVQLVAGSNTYDLTELQTSGYYLIDAIPTGKYSVLVNSVDTGQTKAVGSGQIAALGNEADSVAVSTVDNFELQNATELKTTLDLENVSNVAVPVPVVADENKVLSVDENGDYVLEPPQDGSEYFPIKTAADLVEFLESDIAFGFATSLDAFLFTVDTTINGDFFSPKYIYGFTCGVSTSPGVTLTISNVQAYSYTTQFVFDALFQSTECNVVFDRTYIYGRKVRYLGTTNLTETQFTTNRVRWELLEDNGSTEPSFSEKLIWDDTTDFSNIALLDGNNTFTGSNAFTQLIQTPGMFESILSNSIILNDGTRMLISSATQSLDILTNGANLQGDVNISGTASASTPVATSDLTTKEYVDALDSANAKLSGNNTFTGSNTFTQPVSGVTPVAGSDLTTKDYVDNAVSSIDTGVQDVNNIGSGAEVLAQVTGSGIAQLRTLADGSIISLAQGINDITIDDSRVVSIDTPQNITGAKNFDEQIISPNGISIELAINYAITNAPSTYPDGISWFATSSLTDIGYPLNANGDTLGMVFTFNNNTTAGPTRGEQTYYERDTGRIFRRYVSGSDTWSTTTSSGWERVDTINAQNTWLEDQTFTNIDVGLEVRINGVATGLGVSTNTTETNLNNYPSGTFLVTPFTNTLTNTPPFFVNSGSRHAVNTIVNEFGFGGQIAFETGTGGTGKIGMRSTSGGVWQPWIEIGASGGGAIIKTGVSISLANATNTTVAVVDADCTSGSIVNVNPASFITGLNIRGVIPLAGQFLIHYDSTFAGAIDINYTITK